MKLFIFAALFVTALGLMSFSAAPNSGVRQIGTELYQLDATATVSAGDRAEILQTIAENYRLGDWRSVEGSVELNPIASLKGKWILKKKAFLAFVEEEFIKYDVETPAPQTVSKIAALNQTLATYSADDGSAH